MGGASGEGCTRCSKGMDSARALIEISMDSLNGLSEEAEEWEEIEFMVDSGAGTTVIRPEHAKAVQASEPDPNANYKLTAGSIIHNQGRKTFTAVTEEWDLRSIKAAVTKVDTPLLSVSSCVLAGATVVSSPSGSYIDAPGCSRVPLTASKGVYNVTAPYPVRQRRFAKLLGRVLKRPAFMPLPRFVIKILFGEMGERLTLDSQRVLPDRLVEEGYKFVHENLEDGLRDSLGMWR